MNRFLCVVAVAVAVAVVSSSWSLADSPPSPPGALPVLPRLAAGDDQAIDITADQLEYDADRQLFTGRGHVVVRRGTDMLSADFLTIRVDTQDARAVGNVRLERGSQIWTGEELTYNFKTQEGDFGQFNAQLPPWFVEAASSHRTGTNEFFLEQASATTCTNAPGHTHYHVSCRSAQLMEHSIRGRHATIYIGRVPILWLPVWRIDFGGSETDWDLVPGYSGDMGFFLLTTYKYPVYQDWLGGETHVDFRSARGVGLGQDLLWSDPSPSRAWSGRFRSYWLYDLEPSGNDDAREALDPDENRYRLRLSDVHQLTPRDSFIAEVNYLSDPYVLEDFFDNEYRHNVQPENRLTLNHRGDQYTASLELNRRLNDFYGNVNRLPEARVDLARLPIWDTGFYYQSENGAGWLERVFPEGAAEEDYNAFRVDSRHRVFYPFSVGGFLTLIPRAGYRGTFYSMTYETGEVVNESLSTNADDTVTSVVSTNLVKHDAGAGLRNVGEIGLDASFKAHKLLSTSPLWGEDVGLMHIVLPYIDYSFIPEPNLRPADLPQFDRTDLVDRQHDIVLGVRNKLQTKRRGNIHELLFADLYTVFHINQYDHPHEFSDIFYNVALRPFDWTTLHLDGSFDAYEGEFSIFNARARFYATDDSRLSLEYRFTRELTDQIFAEFSLFPNRTWSFSAYARYSFEANKMQEEGCFISYKTDCLGVGVGLREVDGDPQVWFRIWLTAYPMSSVDLGR